jgi:tetratricopeptide (TPR) repeat protein
MQVILNTAIEMHQNGQFGPADLLYRRILEAEPENAEALHLCGVLHHQCGDHRLAAELIDQAVRLRPDAPIYQANLAEAYRALGDFERAADCCRAALHVLPDYPEALCNLGAALQGMGRHSESVGKFRRALRMRPDFVLAHNNLGIALRELGAVAKALEHFRRAVELEPEFAPVRTNLSQTLLDVGESEEALAHAKEAVRLDPDSAVLHHNLGNVLRLLDRPAEARPSYVEALRLAPDLAAANAHLGLVWQREGNLIHALFWLKKAVELEPANVLFWEWLAGLHEERDQPFEAIPCWERSLVLEPDRPGPHLSLGWDFQQEGRLDEAREHYSTAIRLRPEYGQAHLSLGGLHEELGKMTEAEAAFREALRVQPSLPAPHARLATLLRGKLPEDDLAALEQRLTDHDLDQGPRARLLFGLAHVLDARGEYGRAADCLRESNAITLDLARGRREYSPVDHERFVESLVSAFDRDFFLRLDGAGSDTRLPVFIFGLPRSGTTLIEQVLASHSRIHGAGELSLVRSSFESMPAVMGRSGPPRDCISLLDRAAVQRLAEQHLRSLEAIDDGPSERIVDKMPDNYMYFGLLSVMYPRAVFIHCRRDLRDVAVSCWMSDFRILRWANDFNHIASRVSQYRRLMDHWRAVVSVPLIEVDYEETVSDFESSARRLIAACGLDWEPACLEFYRTERPVRTASLVQVRQPIYQRSVARWKNYEEAMAELFAALPRRQYEESQSDRIDAVESVTPT